MDAEFQRAREAQLAGDPETAAGLFQAICDANPSSAEAHYWLSSACMLLGEPERAEAALNAARTLQGLANIQLMGGDLPRLQREPEYANAVATQLYGQGYVALASLCWGLVIAADHIEPNVLANYALSLQHQGRAEEASDIYRLAAETSGSGQLAQFAVFAQLFCDDAEPRHKAEAEAWVARYAVAPPPAPHDNPPLAGRRLRVGYVAPNFAKSQLRQFITPVLESHDPGAVEVVLYVADAETDSAWPSWIKVRSIGALSDANAAALIRNDRIDVLNDCWGHTSGSRLGVFARKPAPVQVAWINFFQTTGLPQMDYVLHAKSAQPTGLAPLFNEEIWPVADAFSPFRPASGRLPPAPTPALESGQLTFGCFTHPAKVSLHAIAAWAAVLRCSPGSRLLLKYRYYVDPVLQRAFQAHFAAHGVAPERIVFEGHTTGVDYYRAFQAVDLMLDTWPAPGSTTTLEALSNGVPVLAMVGEAPTLGGVYARTMLANTGLEGLVTTTPQDFVDRALELTEDLEALDALRARVRPGFEGGPICDEAGFTRQLETAFAEMFVRQEPAQSLGRLANAG